MYGCTKMADTAKMNDVPTSNESKVVWHTESIFLGPALGFVSQKEFWLANEIIQLIIRSQ